MSMCVLTEKHVVCKYGMWMVCGSNTPPEEGGNFAKIDARQNTASDYNTFPITFPDNMRMKFDMTRQHVAKFNTLKSGDELISLRET